jgi:phage baseplate assembly protein W
MSFDLKIVRGDIFVSRDGTVDIVTGNSKLKQDIIKIMLTELGENKYHPSYGSATGSLQIGSVLDAEMMEMDLSSSAEQAVRRIMSMQRTQAKRQFLSPSEVILDIVNVSVERDQVDPRLYNIFISVLTEKLDRITENVTVRIS